MEVRPARYVPTALLSPSVDSDWRPSTRVQSALATHARRKRCVPPRAWLRRGDDRWQADPSLASVGARADAVAPSAHLSEQELPAMARELAGSARRREPVERGGADGSVEPASGAGVESATSAGVGLAVAPSRPAPVVTDAPLAHFRWAEYDQTYHSYRLSSFSRGLLKKISSSLTLPIGHS
jgi:hypothetical protein